MQLPIFRRKAVERLYHLASNEPKSYALMGFKADGKYIKDDEIQQVPDVNFDPNLFAQLILPGTKKGVGASDAENAFILFSELKGMTPRIAQDERVWCALSHLHGKEFIFRRHIEGIADEKLSRKLQTQFFCRANGKDRGLRRDNALSSLWWWAFICSKVESLTHAEALQTLLESTDFRDAVLGRPVSSRIPQVFESLLLIYQKEKDRDPDMTFLRRKKGAKEGNYQKLMKLVSLHGGRKLYNTMELEDLVDLFWSIRKTIN